MWRRNPPHSNGNGQEVSPGCIQIITTDRFPSSGTGVEADRGRSGGTISSDFSEAGNDWKLKGMFAKLWEVFRFFFQNVPRSS